MAQTDEKNNKQMMLFIGAIALLLFGAAGMVVWAMSGDKKDAPSDKPYENSTPTAGKIQADGSLSINPTPIVLTRAPDGKLGSDVFIMALMQKVTIESLTMKGDPNVTYKGDCHPGKVIDAGTTCQIRVTYNENSNLGAATTTTPELIVTGKTTTPGGNQIVVETKAPVTGGVPGAADQQALAAQAMSGLNGLPAGAAAPSGIDPYGPVQPAAYGATNAPPIDFNQPQAYTAQNPLSAREQFILARRQAVLGNVVHRNANGAVQKQSTGDWDEIGVPKATSSAPQDMSRVVTMDRIITAVLTRTFDSRATQQVVAQVDRNVYSATGRNILIPRGSTVIGIMNGGAERATVNWTQIIRPDGARFMMQASGGDAMGQANIPGKVNNRYGRRFGSVLLGTIIKSGTAVLSNASESPGGGVNVGNGSGGSNARNNGGIITDIVSQDVDRITQQILQETQKIQPIVTVPAGTRMTIVPQQDLVMRPVTRQTIVRASYPRQMNGGAAAPDVNFQIGGGDDVAPTSRQNNIPASGRPITFNAAPQQQQKPNVVEQGLANPGPVSLGATPPWSSN